MQKRKIWVALLVGVLLLASLAACGQDSNTIIMATNAEFPPFEFVTEPGKGIVENYDGIDIVVAKEIADELGKELKISNMQFDAIIPAITSGKANFSLAGMTVKPERLENVDFSEPYWVAVQTIIVQKTNTDITDVESLTGKTVGVVTGYTGDLALDEKGGINLKRYNKGIDAVQDLKNGKLDAVVIDSPTAENFMSKNPDLKGINDPYFETEEYAVAVKKGDKELLDKINTVIKRLKEEGKIAEIASQVDERMAAVAAE
jgi:ABC-type amino acid transport substrate-binding protein